MIALATSIEIPEADAIQRPYLRWFLRLIHIVAALRLV
jgi:hypothetical protein